jgi:hypothetical protein
VHGGGTRPSFDLDLARVHPDIRVGENIHRNPLCDRAGTLFDRTRR